MLYVRAIVTKPNGEEYAASDELQLCPSLLHSLFSQVDIYFNNKLITDASDTYPYKAYLETLLNYGTDARNSQLSASMIKGSANATYSLQSKPFEMLGRLHVDICLQSRLLLNRVDVRIRLNPSKSNFCVLTTKAETVTSAPQVTIQHVSLFIKRVRPSLAILSAHTLTLEQGHTAKYPFRRTQIKVCTVSKGESSAHLDALFLGQLPVRMIIGLVQHSAFTGDYKLSPFNFEHFDVNYLSLTADGEEVYGKPLQPDFKNNLFVRSFFTLFTGTGTSFADTGIDINRNSYKNGNTLYAFDMTPDTSANRESHINLIKQGTVRLELKFAKALVEPVSVIAYAEFENMLEIDRNRIVVIDF